MNNRRDAVLPLRQRDAIKLRAAHRIPSLSVAVETAYQFLRALTPTGAVRDVRVAALPCASAFAVEMTCEQPQRRGTRGAGEAARLSELQAISREVRLCVAGRPRGERTDTTQQTSLLVHGWDIVFEGQWTHRSTNKDEDTMDSVWVAVETGIQEKIGQLAHNQKEHNSLLLRMCCEVCGLFFCMPVRLRGASGREHSSYRLRAEKQALIATAYRMAAESILAPVYLSPSADTQSKASLSLRISDGEDRRKATTDADDVLYVNTRSSENGVRTVERAPKRQRTETQTHDDTHTLRVAYRVVIPFLSYFRLWNRDMEFVNGSALPSLREVVLERGVFAVLFFVPSWDQEESVRRLDRSSSLPGTIVVSRHTALTTCYIVDESHRVYSHVSRIFTTLYPLFVFLTDTFLEGDDATLRKMFQMVAQKYNQGVTAGAQETQNREIREEPLCVVKDLTTSQRSLGNQPNAETTLRVLHLSQRLSSVKSVAGKKRVDHTVQKSRPQRTPFFPLKWAGRSCGTSTLEQVRSTMRLTLDPSTIVTRAYSTPEVWQMSRELSRDDRGRCPFRGKHLIAQWDRKFLLLHLSGTSAQLGDTLVTADQGPSLMMPSALTSTASLFPSVLYIADQHAIHERLRLEFFLATAESYVQQHSAPASFPTKVPDDIRCDVTVYEDILAQWGWRFAHGSAKRSGTDCATATASSDGHSTRSCVAVTQWPHLLLEGRELLLDNIEALRTTVEELITVLPSLQSMTTSHKEGGGNNSDRTRHNVGSRIVPSVIFNFLITRSCRGAVMFGDCLSAVATKQLIEALPAVEQYTLCSHGRPSFAAIHGCRK